MLRGITCSIRTPVSATLTITPSRGGGTSLEGGATPKTASAIPWVPTVASRGGDHLGHSAVPEELGFDEASELFRVRTCPLVATRVLFERLEQAVAIGRR